MDFGASSSERGNCTDAMRWRSPRGDGRSTIWSVQFDALKGRGEERTMRGSNDNYKK